MAQAEDKAWFEQNRQYIAQQYPSLYVVVKNQSIAGAYPDYTSAYNAGVAMFGTEPFLVEQATTAPRVETNYAIKGRAFRRTLSQSQSELLRRDGALVTVQIGVPSSLAGQFQREGKAVPSAQVIRGLIDTGASISTVSDAVAQAAGLRIVGSVQVGGVGGTSEKPIYAASFSLPEYGVSVDPIEMAGVTLGAPGFDVLVGRDILKALLFNYKGPDGMFDVNRTSGGLIPGAPVASDDSTRKILTVGAGVAAIGLAALFAFDVI